MPSRGTILYFFAWGLYVIFSFTMFPVINISVGIPIFVLIGIGAWLFGTTVSLYLVAATTLYHLILFSFIYSEEFITYQTKLSSPLLLITISYLGGHLRKTHDNLRSTHQHLDSLVKERTDQLNARTAKLLDDSETLKNSLGQELHDGLGQQLTGIQLLSTSLSDQLLSDSNPLAAHAHRLSNQTNQAHHHIRKISRMLFPVRIGQVGLTPALNELSAGLNDIKQIDTTVTEIHELPFLPERLSLQLYRVCQESMLYAVNDLKADRIDIKLDVSDSVAFMIIEHNGMKSQTGNDKGAHQLIHYRLKQINGRRNNTSKPSHKQVDKFIIPLSSFPI